MAVTNKLGTAYKGKPTDKAIKRLIGEGKLLRGTKVQTCPFTGRQTPRPPDVKRFMDYCRRNGITTNTPAKMREAIDRAAPQLKGVLQSLPYLADPNAVRPGDWQHAIMLETPGRWWQVKWRWNTKANAIQRSSVIGYIRADSQAQATIEAKRQFPEKSGSLELVDLESHPLRPQWNKAHKWKPPKVWGYEDLVKEPGNDPVEVWSVYLTEPHKFLGFAHGRQPAAIAEAKRKWPKHLGKMRLVKRE